RTLRRVDDPGQDLEEGALAGAVRADHRQRLAAADVQVDVTQGPELVALPAAEHLADRPADRRLPGEPEVVLDAQLGRRDRVLGTAVHPGRPFLHRHQMTFAKFGSRRLKTTVVTASRIRLA